MPVLALVGIPGPRWLPPLPAPLFLLWPAVAVCRGLCGVLGRSRPDAATKLRTAVELFCALRGLTIDVNATGHERVRIRFV